MYAIEEREGGWLVLVSEEWRRRRESARWLVEKMIEEKEKRGEREEGREFKGERETYSEFLLLE